MYNIVNFFRLFFRRLFSCPSFFYFINVKWYFLLKVKRILKGFWLAHIFMAEHAHPFATAEGTLLQMLRIERKKQQPLLLSVIY